MPAVAPASAVERWLCRRWGVAFAAPETRDGGGVPAPPRVAESVRGGELLVFSDRRSALDVMDVPDPGAIWLSALSSRFDEPEPPRNMSVSTRAIWRASPYFTR